MDPQKDEGHSRMSENTFKQESRLTNESFWDQYWRQQESFYRESGLRLTDETRAAMAEIEKEFDPLFDAANQAMLDASATRPDVSAFYKNISPTMNPDLWKTAQQRARDAIAAWEANAPDEWKAAQLQMDAIAKQYNDKRTAVYAGEDKRQYEALGTDPDTIVKLAKKHVNWLINDQHRGYQAAARTASSFSAYDVVALGGTKWALDAEATRNRILKALQRMHFRALGDNANAIDEIKAYIETAIKSNYRIAPEGTPGVHQTIILRRRAEAGSQEQEADPGLDIIRTAYPLTHVAPIDKVSNKIFTGGITNALTNVRMGKRGSGRSITTTVQLHFAPEIENLPTIGLYEKAVNNGICSVYKVGNKIMTDRMIYQAMTGNPDANLSPKQAVMINQAITTLMYTGAKIDMSEELKSRKIPGTMQYDENLIHAKRGTYNLNGAQTTAIELLDAPLSLKIGETKDQIARLPMSAIATPVNKTEESIALQTYLLDRIYAMRGSKKDERRISYATVYTEIWGNEADSKSRTQKKRLRGYMAEMLSHWTTQTTIDGKPIINGFDEYLRGKTAQGILIDV